MFSVVICKKCQRNVKARVMRGFVHVQCDCGCEYELEATSLKYYMLIPFVSVFVALYLNKQWIASNDIFITLVFILCTSYGIYIAICMLLVKLKLFQYSEREGNRNE